VEKYLVFANSTYEDGKFHLEDLEVALNQKVNVEIMEDEGKTKNIGANNWFKNYYNFTSYIIIAIYLTFLINNLTRNRFVINGISTVVSLGTSFISGVFVPQEFLSEKALTVAKFFPTYYFVRINERSINSLIDMRYDILMQVMFGVVFLLMGLYFSKVKQKV